MLKAKHPQKFYLSAFTLVELIVVIVILAILATIAFLSFNSYSSSARDSTRLADVNSLNKGIELYQVSAGYYPSPEGTISVGNINGVDLTFKGIIGDKISKMVNISKTPVDPLSSSNYVYGISYDKKYFQIGVVLESTSNKTSHLDKNNVISSLSRNPFLSLIGYNTSLDNNSIENSIPHLTSPNTGEELISSIFPLTRGNTRGLFDIEQTYSVSGAGNYFSKIKGNYNGIIKFSTGTTNKIYYIANIPSLLYNDTNPNLLNTGTYYIVNNNTNLPYQISSDTTTNNKTADIIVQEVYNSPTATLTGVDITSIITNTGGTQEQQTLINNLFSGTTLSSFGGNIGVVGSIISGGSTSSSTTSIVSNCSLSGTVVNHGVSVDAYSEATIVWNAVYDCTNRKITRACNNGVLDGSGAYMYDSCIKGTPNNCVAGNYSSAGTQVYTLAITLNHSLDATGTLSVGITNGTKIYTSTLSCNDGSITVLNENITGNCNSNYTWNSTNKSCDPATQVTSCTGLPANASWNTVSSITQTWNGSSWSPSIAGTYNTTSSTSSCNYKCSSGYHYYNGSCVQTVDSCASIATTANSCSSADMRSNGGVCAQFANATHFVCCNEHVSTGPTIHDGDGAFITSGPGGATGTFARGKNHVRGYVLECMGGFYLLPNDSKYK